MEITWNVSQLDRRTADGFVQTAHWQANAVGDNFTAQIYGSCSWIEGELEIPYEDLTKEDVLNWVWKSADRESVELLLAKRIESQKNPEQISGLPWPEEVDEPEKLPVEGSLPVESDYITDEPKEI